MNDLFRKNFKLLICMLLAVVVIVLFWQVQYHDFIFYDDNLYVTENSHVQKGLNPENLAWAFSATENGFWHPLTWLSLMLDYQMYKLNAGGYHWTNVLLHMACTVLIFLVFFRMTHSPGKSALIAALFAVHPLHVESVAWVSQRKDVLSAVFWFVTMLMYVHYAEKPGRCRYLFVVLFYMMGLMSKPMVVTLPVILLLIDYWPLGRFPAHLYRSIEKANFDQASIYKLIAEKIPLLILATAVTVLTFYTEEKIGALKTFEMFPLDVRAANAVVSYGAYIWKTFWPVNLAILYPHLGMPPCRQVVSSGVILLLITVFVFYNVRRYPFLAIGWLWYVLTLAPVIGLIQIGSHALADRYTYIPLIGLFVIMVWGSGHLFCAFEKFCKANKDVIPANPGSKSGSNTGIHYFRIFAGFLAKPGTSNQGVLQGYLFFIIWGIALSILAVSTWFQLQYWRDNVLLLQHALRVTERNYVICNNLGVALFQRGKLDEASACFEKTLRIKPDYADALNNMGLVMTFLGKADRAEYYYLKTLAVKPDSEKAHNNLANLFADQGKLREAVDHYKKALKINPDDAEVYNNLGMALARQNRLEEAVGSFKETLRIKPDHADARRSMVFVLKKMGKETSSP